MSNNRNRMAAKNGRPAGMVQVRTIECRLFFCVTPTAVLHKPRKSSGGFDAPRIFHTVEMPNQVCLLQTAHLEGEECPFVFCSDFRRFSLAIELVAREM